jgi:cysteine desulfuration protein SufE
MSTTEAYTEIADTLTFLDDWEERYGFIIELGKQLPPLAEHERSDVNKVRGCASQVWLVSEVARTDSGPVITLRGESDAMIVQGLVAVLIALYSGRPAEEIAETDALAAFDAIGLREHLTSQRANGLASMVARVRAEAQAIAAA